ncbi:efflux RND transporter periplasmic adaptor subunit [Blastochloris sulfoviridis]|uniref:Efflux RND transporter periplasmic adaptor subunit n=1 Tax=Blastochloris sulfoviridis TaxID=50712 RepID=A0A5M6I4G2_9HYPH|nr:efflux RND transporter periplasmic adaptor subunit [Blastochloris sulfoviridis]KAA5602689.1 efflux RND transporter periplasmic adaptor subunit [Blastochloris sulfoviridis]
MTRNKKRAGLAVAALVIAGLAVLGLRAYRAPPATESMMTARATTGDIEQTVLASGTLKPVKLVAVGAQASGRVVSMKVKLGQKVAAGDLIAEIDPVNQQNALRKAQASLENLRAQRLEKIATVALARATLERQKLTLAQRATSRAEFDTAEATVKQTEAQIAALEAQIRSGEVAVEDARANLGYTRVTAPIDGTVLSVVTQEGQTVNATQTAPTMVVLGQIDTMTVKVEISEADVVRVKPGQPVYFTILGDPDRRYHATLESIDPAPESIKSDSSFTTSTSAASSSSSSSSTSSSAIYYYGVFNVPNPERRLRTYMTAQVRIVLGEAKGVLTVPSAALRRSGRGYTVDVVDDAGTVSTRDVEVGLDNKSTAEIRAGLKEGERVVTSRKSDAGTPSFRGPPRPF